VEPPWRRREGERGSFLSQKDEEEERVRKRKKGEKTSRREELGQEKTRGFSPIKREIGLWETSSTKTKRLSEEGRRDQPAGDKSEGAVIVRERSTDQPYRRTVHQTKLSCLG